MKYNKCDRNDDTRKRQEMRGVYGAAEKVHDESCVLVRRVEKCVTKRGWNIIGDERLDTYEII